MTHNFRTEDFDFELPEACIAQQAVEPRDHARLLLVVPDSPLQDHHVYDLPNLLRAGDVIVINNTKVIPARLFGHRGAVKVELLLTKSLEATVWRAFARPGKRLKVGDSLIIAEDFQAEILAKHEGGEVTLRFSCAPQDFMGLLQRYGHVPLPPYIKRPKGDQAEDTDRYQTVYAKHEGSVAAPTAGLHFTPELMQKLQDKGVKFATVTLHVGAGTFLPVKAEHIKDHVMHSEWGEVTLETAALVNQAKAAGGRIMAVGTTALRLLETAATPEGTLQAFADDTAIFIYPGYRFRIVDLLLTNFHLPKSTLFMLVSAFSGLETMRAAYQHAITNHYRFYSYGDASLLERRL